MGGILGHLSDAAIRWFDALALGAVAATFLGLLPDIALIGSVVWIGIRIANEVVEHKIKLQEYRLNKRRLGE